MIAVSKVWRRRNLEVYFTRHRVQRAIIAAGPGILPALAAFVTTCTAQPIGFGIQQCVEGLFNRSTHHLAEMMPGSGLHQSGHLQGLPPSQ